MRSPGPDRRRPRCRRPPRVDRSLAEGYVDGSRSFAVAGPEGGPPEVDLLAAMPYFGRDNFKPPERAAELVKRDAFAVGNFAVANIGFFDRVRPESVPESSGRKDPCAAASSTATATTATTATTDTATPETATTTERTTTSPGTPGPGVAGALAALAGGALARLWDRE